MIIAEGKKSGLQSLLLVSMGLLLSLFAPFELVMEGPFSWAVRQLGAWQGAIELAVLALSVGCVAYYLSGWKRSLLLAALCIVYSRRQGVDFAILASLIYFEGIVSLGVLLYRKLMKADCNTVEGHVIAIAIGLLTWSCIQWTISALGLGSLRGLEYSAAIILGGGLLLERRLPLLAFTSKKLRNRSLATALSTSFTCTVILMLFAKSGVSADFDSMWYGMRGDRLLVASGSVFRSLGLVSPIHYAPQAYELILVPLSALHSIPGIFGFAIWCVAALGFCLYAIGERLGWKPTLILIMLAVALSTPALLNIAITAKGDVLAAFWIFFGIYGLISHRQSGDWRWLMLALAAAIAAICYRMSTVIYASTLALVALVYLGRSILRARPSGVIAPVKVGIWLWIAMASITLFIFVTIRTYLLAGIPFIEPGILVKITEAMGFVRKFPAGNAPPQAVKFNTKIVEIVFDLIFRPGKMSHIVIGWTGAAWAFFIFVGLLLNKFKLDAFRELRIFWLFAAIWGTILLLVYFPDRGGDGNYFIVSVISLLILGLGLTGNYLMQGGLLGRSLRSVVALFVVSSILVALVTGSWGPGTRGFDLKFNRPIEDLRARTKSELTYNGMMPISDFLRKLPRDTRVISVVPIPMRGKIPESWLPGRNESLAAIAIFMPSFTRSVESFEDFLVRDQIQYVMLPTENTVRDPGTLILMAREAISDRKAKNRATIVVAGDRFSLWQLHQ
ncbi:MAG TPA: hypothetical protein VGC19_05825 [Rhodanobacter sp.]